MALSLGSSLANKVYLGATEVALAYLGATQVYTSSAFSAEAQDYFNRLDTAGDTTYTAYKQPLANYIDSLVALGGAYWDTMESSTSFVGVGIQGITVPLRDGMTVPTENNFVAADLDQLTGLKGDGSLKYIASGITTDDAGPLIDVSIGTYLTEQSATPANRAFIGAQGLVIRETTNINEVNTKSRNFASQTTAATSILGFIGHSRSANNSYTLRLDGSSTALSQLTTTVSPTEIGLFRESTTGIRTDARLATYHIGPALNLATLEGLQDTLLDEIAAAKGAAAAENYFARLDTAGDTTYVPYKQPLTNYISSLVALGGAYWDDMESAASFVGVGIQGITVPLRDGMPVITENNFVVGDLDQLTGLKGDGSLKYLSTGVLDNDVGQNDYSISVWVTDNVPLDNAYWIGSSRLAQRSSALNTAVKFSAQNNSSAQVNPSPDLVDGFIGQTRTVGTDFDWFINTNSGNFVKASIAPVGQGISVFAYGAGTNPNSSRIATYHVGPALNLSTLQGLQETLLAEIAGVGFSTEAANYFGRLVNAGDTTFLAYRQPLANYIDSLVTLGGAYWDTMESAASFVGVGIKGITVPLRDGMTVPTQNNFITSDLDQLTGLLCNGSTKRISTNTDQSNYAQNDTSASTYRTEDVSGTNPFYFGTNLANGFGARGTASFITACYGAQAVTGSASTTVGLLGLSRSASTGYDYRSNGTTGTRTTASVAPAAGNLDIFAINGVANGSFRLATYHAGPALDLATLEGLQDTLLDEVAAAAGLAAAENYFSRLDAAGDTTYTPYKQPLTNYISSLVALGGAYWDDMVSSASFVGVGIQGITVPLRDGMTVPTQNNFVAADLNQLTGLKGGNTKELATGIFDNQFTDDNASLSVYATEAATTGAHISNDFNNGAMSLRVGSPTFVALRGLATNTSIVTAGVTGLIGLTRTTDTDLDGRASQTNVTEANAGTLPRNNEIFVLSRNGAQFADSRLATYHIGPALNLATFEGLQDTLITEIAAI